MDDITFSISSVENIPGHRAAVAFTEDSSQIFRDDTIIAPMRIGSIEYIPWGAADDMPFQIIDKIERDETLATCQVFNAEICYGDGLTYITDTPATAEIQQQVTDFFGDNNIPAYFLGVCTDFKHFGFAVSVIILNEPADRILRIYRKEACYCRFSPPDNRGRITHVHYADWRKTHTSEKDIETIETLNPEAPWHDLTQKIAKGTKTRKFAVISRIPTPDSTVYPIPYYAALFRGKWYNIKQLIGIAKEAKLKNSAPIKYHVEISGKYFESIFLAEAITDRTLRDERIAEEKRKIIDFLTGAENSGKAWFSMFYATPDGREQHHVKINKIESEKEGGDWASDIQEAINMICFTMRVHSNLVGSVPGKTQSNNSGSDKRELYTIAQALQKPYRDILFTVHRLIIRYNRWSGYRPVCPFIQLTTLDRHTDAKKVTTVN